MRIPYLTRLTVGLILASPQVYLHADKETTRKQVQAMYDTLATLMIPKPEKDGNGKPGKVKTMLVLANPALSISEAPPAQAASSSGDSDDDGDSGSGGGSDDAIAKYQSTYYIIADRLMEAVPQYNPRGNSTLSATIYENILNHSTLRSASNAYTDAELANYINACILVNGELPRNPDGRRMTEEQLAALNAKLPQEQKIPLPTDDDRANNKKAFKAWLHAKAVYNAKSQDYQMALRDKSKGASNRFGKASNAWNTAQDQWSARKGDTTMYQAALETIRTWNNGSPAVWFYSLNQTNNDYPRMDARYGGAKPVVFIPDVLDWNPHRSDGGSGDDSAGDGSSSGGDGWSKFSFSDQDYSKHQESHNSSTSASASISYGGFDGNASISKTHMDASDLTKNNSFALSMEIKRVDIWRPWLDDNVWNNPAWQPTNGTALYGKVISWGDVILNGIDSAANPLPLAPLVPTTFILARNITLSVKSATTFNSQEEDTLSTAVSASWGPISFSYDHQKKSGSEDHDKKRNKVEFSSKGVTLLGFVGEALDRSPYDSRGK